MGKENWTQPVKENLQSRQNSKADIISVCVEEDDEATTKALIADD